MNYIYDVFINLNEKLYEFFEWKKEDKVMHIKKIPFFKIQDIDFCNIVYNSIKISNAFLNSVYNKTEIWNSNKKIEYCALFSDGFNIIVIEFDKNGYSKRKSFLFPENEFEIIDIIYSFKVKKIEYNILRKEIIILNTRKEIEKENFIINELKNIEFNKLKYLYFECFDKKCNNKNIILNEFYNLNKKSLIYKNLYEILKITSNKKNKML